MARHPIDTPATESELLSSLAMSIQHCSRLLADDEPTP